MSDENSESIVTWGDIIKGLGELGLGKNDTLLVHSSLKSFGRVENGAEAVIDALLTVTGPRGCVVMPTLTLGKKESPVVFDIRNSPSTSGYVSDVFRQRPDAFRSRHPTGSAAAIGWAADVVTGYHNDTPCGLTSPYGQVYLRGGWCLFLGAPWISNTMFHVAEEIVMPEYLRFAEFPDAIVIDEKGDSRRTRFRRYNCFQTGVRRDLNKVGEYYENMNAVRTHRIGNCVCKLIAARDVIEISSMVIREHAKEIFSYDN